MERSSSYISLVGIMSPSIFFNESRKKTSSKYSRTLESHPVGKVSIFRITGVSLSLNRDFSRLISGKIPTPQFPIITSGFSVLNKDINFSKKDFGKRLVRKGIENKKRVYLAKGMLKKA
ncbi:MAG: hypothetical protein RLN83_11430 [Balneola sp.]